MIHGILSNEIFWLVVLAVHVFLVVFITKKIYEWMISKNVKQNVAVYYNRKLVHIFVGGVVVVVVPLVFRNPWYPLFCGLGLTFLTFFAHESGKIFYWFQRRENWNDTSFCLMWAFSIFILWVVTDSPWIAIIPALFMSVGDGMTGIARNAMFKKRNKHPLGNVVMLLVCLPLGFYFADMAGLGFWGVFAAIVAAFVERFEFGPIDDNIFITVSSMIILYVGTLLGPVL